MNIQTHRLKYHTAGHGDMLDITADVQQAVRVSDVRDGIVTIFVPGSTAALTTIEYEDGAINDFRRLFEEIAAENRPYEHNQKWGDGNGHSHVRAALLGASLTVPFVEAKLLLGQWQQIILVDFDNRSRERLVICQVMGE